MIRERLVGTWAGEALMSARERWKLLSTAILYPEQFGTIYNDQIAARLVVALAGDCFVDIGAHIGSVSAAVLRQHPSAHIIAIEAVPEKAAWLKRRFPSIDVRECAVADKRGRTTFYVDLDHPGYSSLLGSAANAAHTRRTIEVEVIPLDELLPNESVSLIKIDVEGAEYAVLCGASALTARCRPVFVFESGPWAQAEGIWKWFSARDYAVLSPSRVPHDDPGMSLDGFLEGHRYPRTSTNYVAMPNEKRAS